MLPPKNVVQKYIDFFAKKIIGFEEQEIKYMAIPDSSYEFLLIVMDRVARLTREYGRLRYRVWSNCYFIFHNDETSPDYLFMDKIKEIKTKFPYFFIRSYVYFIYVDISRSYQGSLFGDQIDIETSDYKIWLFNSKYEIQKETSRSDIFKIKLSQNEKVDDVIYITNPESEIVRLRSANSDVIDCVKAFTGDLVLLDQTVTMLDKVEKELESNRNARILLEGPARSGKTIIASSLLGKYKDAKFLLMNYFFYQAIIDGFHALSNWSKDEIGSLVKNPELDLLLTFSKSFPKLLGSILKNLKFAEREYYNPKENSNTKKWLLENIRKILDALEICDIKSEDFDMFNSLRKLYDELIKTPENSPFKMIDIKQIKRIQSELEKVVNGRYDELVNFENLLTESINELIKNSKQRFFHHNINKSISKKVSEGCWITRGNPTQSKMWTSHYTPKLIVCDEVQRLGLIPEIYEYDEFDETENILMHSEQTFFTGDNFQRLNCKYDKGIDRINEILSFNEENLKRYKLPEAVGVPAEVGLLMKYLTNPKSVDLNDIAENWKQERYFKIALIKCDQDRLVEMFDVDQSNKKHFASPMDSLWIPFGAKVCITTKHRELPIISLINHEKEHFAYKYPYFCNEEIMPNYLLSAYELISREVESLYIHVPKLEKVVTGDWYRNHMYVLFTRPTSNLVVNFEDEKVYYRFKMLAENVIKLGTQLPITFI